MNRLLTILSIIMTSVFFSSCEKDKFEIEDNIALEAFSFEPLSNSSLNRVIDGVIEGKNVYIRVPNAVDIKAAIPTFKTSSSKVLAFIGTQLVESGVTPIDLSKEVNFRLSSANALSEYKIVGLKSATIISFGFYAEDNEGVLFKDYAAKISQLDVNIELPVDADLSNLVARYTTSDGATVKYNGLNFVSSTTALDYSQPVQLELIDAEMEQPEIFTVTVGRLTAPVWTEIQLPSFARVTAASAKLEINPITNQPYIMFQRGGSTDLLRKAVMIGYDIDSKSWKNIGQDTLGFTASRVSDISFSFNKAGDIYAAYKDYEAGDRVQNASIQKFSNNSWNYVGGLQASYNRVNVLSSQVDENGTPFISYALARAASPYANRSNIIESFSGTWSPYNYTDIGDIVFTKLIKGNDNKLYLLLMPRTNRKPSIVKLHNGVWTPVGQLGVGPSFANAASGLDFDADVTEDGQIFLAYQAYEGTTYISYVIHWNGTSWNQLGDGFPAVTSNVSSSRNNVAVQVHPDGRIFFAYGDAGQGLKVTTFNSETNNWNPATVITTKGADKYEMRISKEGIPYLVTVADGVTALFKYDIPE